MRPIPMSRIWAAVAVVGLSALYLVLSTLLSSGFAYVPVCDLRDGSAVGRIKMHGQVKAGSTQYDPGLLTLFFVMSDKQGEMIDVQFKGIKPNAFRDDAQVMIEGYYDASQDLVMAESLFAKCPSRYDDAQVAVQGAAVGL